MNDPIEQPAPRNFMSMPGTGRAETVIGVTHTYRLEVQETAGALACVDLVVPPGHGLPPHTHHLEDEIFYVTEGTVEFVGDDIAGPVSLPQGGCSTAREEAARLSQPHRCAEPAARAHDARRQHTAHVRCARCAVRSFAEPARSGGGQQALRTIRHRLCATSLIPVDQSCGASDSSAAKHFDMTCFPFLGPVWAGECQFRIGLETEGQHGGVKVHGGADRLRFAASGRRDGGRRGGAARRVSARRRSTTGGRSMPA